MRTYRQGDVLVRHVEELPDGARKIKRDEGKVVLAYGEATGHAHAIAERGAELYEVEALEVRFLQILCADGVELAHQEHDTIGLPPGIYEVRRQREYSPEAIRNVAD